MQSVPISEIVESVKIILDENIKDDPVLVAETNQLQLEDIIRARIIDSVRSIHEASPSEMLDDGLDLPGAPVTLQDGSGYINLPADFMRLVIFQLGTWRRPVTLPISDTDPKYYMQKSRFLGIRGGPEKPVCAITTGLSGRVLEFYSVASGSQAAIVKAKYLPLPAIANESILICKKLYTSILWQCAGMVMLIFKDQSANNFFEIAKSYL